LIKNWKEHLDRMNFECLPKPIVAYQLRGREMLAGWGRDVPEVWNSFFYSLNIDDDDDGCGKEGNIVAWKS
jgi:hypothetical protein